MKLDMNLSALAWVIFVAAAAGAVGGFLAGVRYGPSYYDAVLIDGHLREVFCEMAVKNSLLKNCYVKGGL